MPLNPLQLLLGVLLGLLVAWAAYRARALDRSGALAAAVEGALIFGLGGLRWAVLLLAFFLTSSALSRLFGRRKSGLAEKFSKGSRRDAGQVLANGGVAAGFVLLDSLLRLAFSSGATWTWVAFAASLAAVNADTWATELGVLSRRAPRLITSGRPVEPGTSGGITLDGTLAALAGAFLIGALAAPLAGASSWRVLLAVTVCGLLGALFDSFLGATVQAIYACPACGKQTERHPLHTCGAPTRLARGWPWLDNDWVNAACALFGALTAVGVWLLF